MIVQNQISKQSNTPAHLYLLNTSIFMKGKENEEINKYLSSYRKVFLSPAWVSKHEALALLDHIPFPMLQFVVPWGVEVEVELPI